MTTLQQIATTCPACQSAQAPQLVVSTNSHGGKRTDFHPRAVGTQPLPYYVHVCDRCGFADMQHAWHPGAVPYTGSEPSPIGGGVLLDTDADDDDRMRARRIAASLGGPLTIATHGVPAPSRDPFAGLGDALPGGGLAVPRCRAVPGSAKYERLARLRVALDEGHRMIGDAWLRAAWCAVDEGDHEAERFYRLQAARSFVRGLNNYDAIDLREQPVVAYLAGELYRRAARAMPYAGRGATTYHDAARHWFNSVPGFVAMLPADERPGLQWVVDAARQQRDDPREWFG